MPDELLDVPFDEQQPSVLAVHCSEPGAQQAFRQIMARHHGESTVEAVAVPGGAWWVARAANATRGKARRWLAGRVATSMDEAIEAALARQSLKAVELLGHQGCGWYERLARGTTAGELVRRQGEDLYVAAEELARWSRLPVAGRIILTTPSRADGEDVVRIVRVSRPYARGGGAPRLLVARHQQVMLMAPEATGTPSAVAANV